VKEELAGKKGEEGGRRPGEIREEESEGWKDAAGIKRMENAVLF